MLKKKRKRVFFLAYAKLPGLNHWGKRERRVRRRSLEQRADSHTFSETWEYISRAFSSICWGSVEWSGQKGIGNDDDPSGGAVSL